MPGHAQAHPPNPPQYDLCVFMAFVAMCGKDVGTITALLVIGWFKCFLEWHTLCSHETGDIC